MKNSFNFDKEVQVTHSNLYGESLQNWLQNQLEALNKFDKAIIAIDVGAYKGEFFEKLLSRGLIHKAYLFEANPNNSREIKKRFLKLNIKLEEIAVSDINGDINFGFGTDGATGSLLSPIGPTPIASEQIMLQSVTLDIYTAEYNIDNDIDVLKIDTQGSDLQVLKGAKKLLEKSQPIVIAELIFAPLYKGQCSPYELISWMSNNGYQLAGFYDEHYSREGWLSWCDACFLPITKMNDYKAPFRIRTSSENHAKEQQLLEKEVVIKSLSEELFNQRKKQSESFLDRIIKLIRNLFANK